MIIRCLIFFLFLILPAPASAKDDHMLAVDLAQDYVDITTGFNGATLTLFGMQQAPGLIAITIQGPNRTMIVRKKERTAGIWMNRSNLQFENVPGFYSYALHTDLENLSDLETLRKHRIGTKNLVFPPFESEISDEKQTIFNQALVRNKIDDKLFADTAETISFINPNFFRTQFFLPANVPTGEYIVRTFLFHDGDVEQTRKMIVNIRQVGTSAGIHGFAQNYSLIYGVFCVLFALTAGWLSNHLRRRT